MLAFGQLLAWLEGEKPPCKCGRRGGFKVVTHPDWRFICECPCGRRFLRRVSHLWYEILPNGDAQLYMQRDFWCRWKAPSEKSRATKLLKHPPVTREEQARGTQGEQKDCQEGMGR
jgi:hypothetical protein